MDDSHDQMQTGERRVTRKDALLAAGTVGVVAGGAVGFAGVIGLLNDDADAAAAIVARRVERVPFEDPDDSAWDGVPEFRADLLAQQLVPPSLDVLGVATLDVRALHDGTNLGLRLSWEDPSVDDLDGIGAYHDACAVMMPVARGQGAPPPITMGAPGKPVHILQWRATWQRDIDSQGKTGVDQIYPQVIHDVMPDDVLDAEAAALYWVGRAAGNPLSRKLRTTSVEQVVAEGFGTTTHVPSETARGRGVHDGERWAVALGFPAFADVKTPPAALSFAIWMGSQENRGGRKHYADWVPLRVEDL